MENKSGLSPVEYKILILPEDVERKTESGIILTDKITDREKMAQVRGKLIAVGGNAFEDWQEPIPKVGDTISYAKYAGLVVKGIDEIEYRLANDKDITAILQFDIQATGADSKIDNQAITNALKSRYIKEETND